MNKIKRIAGVLALSMALAACHSVQETNPNQVAPTQQIKQLTGGGGGGFGGGDRGGYNRGGRY